MTLSPLSNLATLVQEGAPAAPPGGGAPASGGGLSDLLLPMVLVIGIFYFVLILPERKKQKQRTAMLSAMKKGDKVMTSAGLYGTVAQIQDDVITLQVADGVRLRFARAAIQTILTDGKTSETPETSPDAKRG